MKIYLALKYFRIMVKTQHFDGFLDKLKKYPNIEYLGDLIEHSWGQRVIRFYDLDGHIIEVGEDMKMVVNRFLISGMTMEEVKKELIIKFNIVDFPASFFP